MPKPPLDNAGADTEERLELMRVLGAEPALSQRDISKRLGLSLGKANYLLRALLEKGYVKAENFRRSDNKTAYAYLLTPKGIAEKLRLTRAFLERKTHEFEALKREIRSLKTEVAAHDTPSADPAPRNPSA
jgi:EPS-associated MarR family transcriptional regulator